MDIFWIILGVVLMIVGFAGSILPFLPGPPLCFIALLLQQLQDSPPYSTKFLVVWALVTVAITVLDYIIPIAGTRKFGGSSYGMWGCTIGLLGGFWLGPIGIIIGPFIGAFIGELINDANTDKALRAAFGSFIGFVAGTLLKVIVCGIMAWHFIDAMDPIWAMFS